MQDSEDLSYYEYWTTKEVWPLWRALEFLYEMYKFRRGWMAYEEGSAVYGKFTAEVNAKLLMEDAYGVFSCRTVSVAHYDDDGQFIPEQLLVDESGVYRSKFIAWAYAKGYQLPYEFRVFIGIEGKPAIINEKIQYQIDKAVCQGIARTLWDEYPKMTIEQMYDHKAIQFYGSGRMCCVDTTLRRWLAEVDPREKKTGRKKKV